MFTPNQAQISFSLTGMTCASCVRRVEKAIGKVAGVDEVAVNLATERARVSFDSERTTVDEIARAVERNGYGVGELPVAPVASLAVSPGSSAHS